jgi:hypothetical protein
MPSANAFFTGRRIGASSSRVKQPRAAARSQTVVVQAKGKKVLIVNTKKGGHAFLGLYLAKRLLGAGLSVTITNDGDPVCSFLPVGLGPVRRLQSQARASHSATSNSVL